MAKTDYITSSDGRLRLCVIQSDIQNPTAADPYVNVTVYLQASSYYSGKTIRLYPTTSAALLGNTYTYSSNETQFFAASGISGWKTILTPFSSKGIWSVSKTRTAFSVSFSCADVATDNGHQYNVSISGTVSMQSWPVSGTKDVASVPSSMTMGSAASISITHKTTGNKNTLTWKFGSKSGTLLSSSTSTSVSFTPATSLGAQIPSASSGTITFTLTTYNSSGTNLGSTTYTAKLSVPSYSLSTPTVSAAKNTYTTIGAYVANKTKTRFTLSGLPSGSYGATVTGSYVIKLGTAQQTSGTKTGTSSSNVDYTASAAGSLQLTYTVKDSRGKTASASASVTYVANQTPTISFSAARDSATLTNWAGTATGTYWNITGNTATITFSQGTAGTPTVGSGAFSCGVSGSSLAETSSLSVKATVTDSLGNTASKSVTISTVFAYMEATPNRVIAIGQKAPTDVSDQIITGLPVHQRGGGKLYQYDGNGKKRTYLEYGDIYLYNSSEVQKFHVDSNGHVYPNGSSSYIADFVVEQGTQSSWNYRKWASGKAECWRTITFSKATSAWSTWATNAYIFSAVGPYTYPFTFSSRPTEIAYLTPNSATDDNVWGASLISTVQGSATQTTKYQGWRPTKPTATAYYALNIYAVGTLA